MLPLAVILDYLPCLLLIALLGAALWWANRLAQQDEEYLARKLTDAGWRVKYGGDVLARASFRLRWAGRLGSWLVLTRPLAIKESREFSAWFFECVLYDRVVLVVQYPCSTYPSVVLTKGATPVSPRRLWGWSPPNLVERCHELTRLWFTSVWQDREREVAFLSAIEEALLGSKRAMTVEMSRIREHATLLGKVECPLWTHGDILGILKKHNLTDLGLSALAALKPIQFHLDLPDTGKIGKAFRLARNILGKSNGAQEFIGKMGTAMILHLMKFGESRLVPAHSVWGPDGIVRHETKQDLWAIFEAKGGSSKLGTSTLSRPNPFPSEMKGRVFPGTQYEQMGKEWLEFWIRKTIDKNRHTLLGRDFVDAFDPGKPILTGVVSVNLNRRQEELKFAAQVFVSQFGTGFNKWPVGF